MTAELDLEEGPPVFEGSVSRPFQLVGAGSYRLLIGIQDHAVPYRAGA